MENKLSLTDFTEELYMCLKIWNNCKQIQIFKFEFLSTRLAKKQMIKMPLQPNTPIKIRC